MRNNAPWQAAIRYLYYNPAAASKDKPANTSPLSNTTRVDFSGWPDLQLRCAECWLWGQNMAVSTVILPSGEYAQALRRIDRHRLWPHDGGWRVGE